MRNLRRHDLLVVGLGNPGKEYEKTRHNTGARCVRAFSALLGVEFRRKILLRALVARGECSGKHVVLLLPKTCMNVSGPCVAQAMERYGVSVDDLLVVTDDVSLPIGALRMRGQGGTGGHNGLKSIHEALGTDCYARLRIGVGDRSEGDLASHVLSNFSPEEEKRVLEILGQATEAIQLWCEEGLNRAMNAIRDLMNRDGSESEPS